MTRFSHKTPVDMRHVIDEFRLHDKIDAVVSVLLNQNMLFNLEGVLVRRKSPNAQGIVVVTQAWMDALLRNQFYFEQNGKPVEPPPSKFILARWRSFPSVLKTGRACE